MGDSRIPPCKGEGCLAETLLASRYRSDGDGIAIESAGDLSVGAGELVERGERGLVVGIERVNLVANHQGVLGALTGTGTRTVGFGAGHHVVGAAHRVAHLSSETLGFVGGEGEKGSSEDEDNHGSH